MSWIHFFTRCRAIWKPEMFQGWGKKSRYFEGWYFKLVSADRKEAIALIPGISLSREEQFAFIQVMDGTRKTADFHRFPYIDFVPDRKKFAINVENHYFSSEKIVLNLPDLQGELRLIDPVPFPGSFFAPGIMGWYSFVPAMQCYHGLVSMHHRLEGNLHFKGRSIDFDGGKGYLEKDWGRSFPRAWVWTQCNHYQGEEDISVMASVAHIPWLGSYFIGFLAVVYYQKKLLLFTTYTHARCHLTVTEGEVRLQFRDKEKSLEILARQAPGTDLLAPQQGQMIGKVNESLMATHWIRIKTPFAQFEGQGSMAGLEVGGDSAILVGETKR